MSKELFNERSENQTAGEAVAPRPQGGKIRVKVIINDGITVAVLADGEVEVEVIDVDADYGDYEALKKYQEELLNDPNLKNVDYSVACFEKEGSDDLTEDERDEQNTQEEHPGRSRAVDRTQIRPGGHSERGRDVPGQHPGELPGLRAVRGIRCRLRYPRRSYSDAGQVAAWAGDAVGWAVADGIVAGTSKTTLGPEEKTTRAQFALILQRFCQKFMR